jgi:hypothetical protein
VGPQQEMAHNAEKATRSYRRAHTVDLGERLQRPRASACDSVSSTRSRRTEELTRMARMEVASAIQAAAGRVGPIRH